MWYRVVTINHTDFGTINGVWIAPDGNELLLLTHEQTLYWSVREGRALWSLSEKSGGDGISPDGRLYRDLSSGLFYPLLGSHGGRQLHSHPTGGHLGFDEKGRRIVSDPAGVIHRLSDEGCFGDWQVASFCESGDHILIASPRCLTVYVSPSAHSSTS
uniref:PQQ-like domain-containing protein n=1 Tax=Candidatus Kentrum sp. MB TaxID=2138164 RepID=A0A451B957_9GAMM|nr:MAG: hypothetical protein BECKMB1821G_GA0114241_103228 [Candidatus Kentron sp. MB]VFK29375.1 MAG: hypothetical protein BECKMB1821I_GA0114274_100952 [Candidatus Kentron sp. MB]VFK74767.1 MAG: hypothetical protein BECKMB1821H_GA0114242_100952 [Candidatus Kentron sp. MB]